ncbi:thermonuclease family protein [Notoacmeibacter ruber]|uniref:Thermonuclease family protein n=2 Tax=Notoacmeibacter ruber TaxID=2670375 RepID=A0A3L7J386_9HYPH|nr:thermonuclease family protein [Notoacmeibacter ruber]
MIALAGILLLRQTDLDALNIQGFELSDLNFEKLDAKRWSLDELTVSTFGDQITIWIDRLKDQLGLDITSSKITTVEGVARIIDGDTLAINDRRIRLFGIDAPESDQTCKMKATGTAWRCGDAATETLAQLIGTRPISCEIRDTDRYGRLVGICQVGSLDLNSRMVAEGFAMAYRRYSLRYVDEESAARSAALGLWSTEFERRSDWRRH